MKRYEQFAFVISGICAFILLLNLVRVIHLGSLYNTLLTAVTLAAIATFNIRNFKFAGILLYVIAIAMLILFFISDVK
nr:hypothetical protein [Mammaliicoccus sp. Marseille-Q6498]